MENDVPYGICNQSVANSDIPFSLQMATGTQTAILRPSDGKVIYHLFGRLFTMLMQTTTGNHCLGGWGYLA